MKKRTLSDLTVDDLMTYPVWEMIDDAKSSDAVVRPVKQLPVATMKNRLVGTQVRLADGARLWALLGNVSPNNPRSTKHFLTVSVHCGGRWFDLARYHDVDFGRRNGEALANFLGKPQHAVFPIRYDIADVIVGSPASLVGEIHRVPDDRLSEDELVRLSLERD